MCAETGGLDLGKLLRARAMVNEAAQTEATRAAGIALVRAYNSLRDQVSEILRREGLEELHKEYHRLFTILDEPSPFSRALPIESGAKLEAAASEALLNLRKLGGWIQGLI